jgi:DNA-binding MarR family transcriptional regulator
VAGDPGERADGDLGDDDDAGDAEPTPAELRRHWDDAAQAVRHLERRGGPKMPEAVLEAARRHRDEAERRWRAAKPAHPIGRRIRWAAEAVEAAMEKQRVHKEELVEFEENTARRRGELLERQAADDERVARKQRELDDLRAEAGPTSVEEAAGARAMEVTRQTRPTMWATRAALEGIQADVGPALERAVEALPEGSAAWCDLQGVLSAVTSIHGILDQAVHCGGEARAHYIGDDGSAGMDDDVDDSLGDISLPEEDPTGGVASAEGGDGREERGDDAKRRAVEGPGGGAARWVRHRDGGGEGAWQKERHSAGGDAQPCAAATTPTLGARACEVAARVEEAEARRAEQEAADRRRLEASYTPEQRAQAENLHAQQRAAASAGFGTAEAREIARRVHLERVDQIVKAAREKDIEFSLAELRDATAEELEDWARRHV